MIRMVAALVGFLLLNTTMVFSQQAVTRMEGHVYDEATGKPIGCKLYVYDPSGKRSQPTNVSSTDGSYLVLMNQAGEFKLAIAGYNVLRKEFSVTIPASTKFTEIKRDFKVRELKAGEQWFSVRGFDLNSASLTAEARKELADMGEKLRANQEFNVVFSIAPDADQLGPEKVKADAEYHKAHEAWVKATKKAKKGTVPPPEPMPPTALADPNDKLLDDRIAAVKAALGEVKNADLRLSFKKLPLPTTTSAAEPMAATPAPAGKKGSKAKPAKTVTKAAPAPAMSMHATLTANTGNVKKLFDN